MNRRSILRYHLIKMGKVIAVANQKGGVGKTTSAVNIAAGLGICEKNTLLIDIDPQGNATSGVGIDKRTIPVSAYDVLINGVTANEAVFQTVYPRLDILPSSLDLAAADLALADMPNREFILKNAVSTVRGYYDYIIIDCPPSLGLVTINALSLADTVLVPIQCEFYALEGLSQLMSTVRIVKRKYNPLLDIEGVLLTMYDGRLNLTQQVVEEVKKFFPKKVFSTVIPRSVRISEAPSHGKPIMYYDRSNKGSDAYMALANEIIRRNKVN